MEELKIKVTKETADALRKVAEAAHIPIGEVVDRHTLDVAPDDPDVAFLLILEQYLVCVSRLSKEGSAKVFGDVCGTFLGSIPPEELDEMVAEIKSLRNWEDPSIEPDTEEEQAEFKKAMDKIMFQTALDEDLRAWLYGLLHG